MIHCCGSVSGWYLKLVFPHDALVVDIACVNVHCTIVHISVHSFSTKCFQDFANHKYSACVASLYICTKNRAPASVLFWPLVLNASFTSSLPRLVNVKICKLVGEDEEVARCTWNIFFVSSRRLFWPALHCPRSYQWQENIWRLAIYITLNDPSCCNKAGFSKILEAIVDDRVK